MFFKTCAALALATGLAVAKPIFPREPQDLPAYHRRGTAIAEKRNNGNGFNFIDGFNNINNQKQVIQIQEQNLQIIDNGFQQAVIQQANEVLIVNQENNGFRNDLSNVFRKSNFRNNFNDVSTVMLVVQEIQVAVDNGRGGVFEQQVFAQSAVVANRGAFQTQTVMIFAQETLIAKDILGGVGGFGGAGGVAGVGGLGSGVAAALPTKTADVQLFGAKPTWSQVAEDPAATLGGVWEAEIQDLQNVDNDAADNDANNNAAAEEKKALDEAKAAEDAQQQQDQQQQDQQNNEDQNAEDQQQAQEGEQQQKAQDGEQQAQKGEQAQGQH